ncbi:amidase signature enzyme [Epithele typhae]|uniref:amidase signature enzyme n=1 Tax=Epithele typhae TaxID=378194 RepID=UPI002008974E|nr:amidase signature enzyme [Epithele typhae]KAH9942204.1 amidase signature enzyme [Epithele typhae]
MAGVVALLLVTLSAIHVASGTSVQSTGRTLTVGGVSYFAPPVPVSSLHNSAALTFAKKVSGELVPFSVILTSATNFNDAALEKTIAEWSTTDDVWSKAFLSGIYLSYNGTALLPVETLGSTQARLGIDFVMLSKKYTLGFGLTVDLPSGPYFLDSSTGNIFEAYRLYSDQQQSFVYGTIPNPNGGFEVLSAGVTGAATPTVAVPSRLYFTPTAEKPLAGKRLAVKDIYDVAGLHTGCGNRAFFDLYPAKNTTAPAVQRLLDGGMVLVGKTKTSQFANGESATADWIDLHAPYNPRGDGYQDGSSSSTGSGTAVAAYDWLDFAIGSDTGGSMRGPAGANGVFGNRPSHGAVSLDDVMPLAPELDTGGIFSRDARLWATAGHWWYDNFTSFTSFPKKIIIPTDFFSIDNPPVPGTSDAIYNDFITQLEGFLDVSRTKVSVAGIWNATKPANVSAPSLSALLQTTYADLITLDQIALVADPFIDAYKAAHGGQSPFINPAPLARWAYGRALPAGRKDAAIANKAVFMNWWASEVVRADEETCSDAVLLYPQNAGHTAYRNTYPGTAPGVPLGFSAGRIAVHGEVPDMVIPIGEVPYNSTITGTTEFLPVTISFIAAKNCDLMLFNLFAALQDAGIIKPVVTGSRIWGA